VLILNPQRVGPLSQEQTGLADLPLQQRRRELRQMPSTEFTAKQLRAAWKKIGEAGDFVELETMGGIIGFDTDLDQGKPCYWYH
jgi:hypothetical protein